MSKSICLYYKNKKDDWQLVCVCLKRSWWVVRKDSSVWLERAKKSCCLPASGDSLSLLHWCNEIWIRRHNSTPAYPCISSSGGGKAEWALLHQYYPEDCCVEEVQTGLTGTRSMFADQRSAGQTAALVSGEMLVGTRHLQHYLHFQPFLMQATC